MTGHQKVMCLVWTQIFMANVRIDILFKRVKGEEEILSSITFIILLMATIVEVLYILK